MSSFSSPIRSNNFIPKHKSTNRKHNVDTNRYLNYDPEKEPIKAYLRIRPKPENYNDSIEKPYIEIVNHVEVIMHPPENSYRARHKPPERYRFTQVFDHTTDQREFFNETTLELVKDVLRGNNALLFAYGVTNSGKTYSIMGKETEEDVGLLPRTLYTIFKSIHDRKSEAKLKPVMDNLVQPYECNTEENREILNICQLQENLSLTQQGGEMIEIDSNFEYGIWVSFIEVYNEQVYDLLDVKRRQRTLQLKYDQRSGNKYVADVSLVKVKSMEEADAIMRLGHQNRHVFSTLMNQTSSRSHSVFTIHVVRCPIENDEFVIEDPNFATISKLSIVDLAGSERYRNTNSTGQRLKEAGNINKSLMVLGQCMETLRMNQIKTDMGKTPTMVPFRHSKLTELFKSTFEGDGKAVIIVNVNPFDTGFDENNHVMKFAAVARNVTTTWRPIQPTKIDFEQVEASTKRLRNGVLKNKQNIEEGGEDKEDEDNDDDDDDDDDDNDTLLNENAQFIDNLIDQIEDLWEKWVDIEARNNTLEFEIRDQVSREMDIELKKMEDLYLAALKRENDLMNIQLENRLKKDINDENDNEFLKMVHERQNVIIEEMNYLKQKLEQTTDKISNNNNNGLLLERIAKLEKENQKERKERYKLERYVRMLEKKEDDIEDMNDDDDLKRTMDVESFQQFLNLRKQLRRSIFKKEELGEDADTVMKQIEQFKGVTFKLAKDTKMGKLLKLIIQEDFEKDPYQIRNRAIQLFKRYSQLMDLPAELPLKNEFSNLNLQEENEQKFQDATTMTDITDIEKSLKIENTRLRQKIKILNEGQKRLKEAFENTLLTKQILSRPLLPSEDVIMTENKNNHNDPETIHVNSSEEENDINEYESDITEILKQDSRQKRRRKLRER
ncbi:kinesin motor domain-containing protein [Cokeromyces recurvatus]|uniref:kinesin motor domain-containing protein n=1 Tax=Cokeromyces recurvatus TaxID=90255 RepID=UPI00221F58A5|nr:kinesin motor domain-containing protein [Cokeromyces recurvatus]KAI7900885.1 kinesin motor domain-containing protein [Cokeromyces recurvatus]